MAGLTTHLDLQQRMMLTQSYFASAIPKWRQWTKLSIACH